MNPTMPDRARELFSDLAKNMASMAKAISDLTAYGYSPHDIMRVASAELAASEVPTEAFAATVDVFRAIVEPESGLRPPGAMTAIRAILGEQTKATCAVMFRSGSMLQGEITETAWGQLRMVSTRITPPQGPGIPPMSMTVEQFFDYEDVCVVAREIPGGASEEPSRIVRS